MSTKSTALPAEPPDARLPGELPPLAPTAERSDRTNGSHRTQNGADTVFLVQLARRYLHARRRRGLLFADEIFADPCWDMLLDLFVSQALERDVSVSSVCIASCVPQTTALRWLARLEALGLVERSPDPKDGRRTLIRLSELAAHGVREWLVNAFPSQDT